MLKINQQNKEEFLPGYKNWRKKPVAVRAVKLTDEFEVETLEGTMRGKPGDWLLEGVGGEVYPVNAQIFAATYERID